MKIGFIGCGNMAQAMIGGILNSGTAAAADIMASRTNINALETIKQKYGINVTTNNQEVAKFSDILILSVKPFKYAEVISEIKDCVKDNVIIVTVAAGIPIDFVEKTFEKDMRIVRTMPNTPALVGEGMTALCANKRVSKEELNSVIRILESFGKAEIIEERLMDAVPAISGSSPAYVYMMIEAMGDAGVLQGIPRDKAYKFAAQAVLGAAKMVLETGEHPGSLKDKVCSPSGTTIEAVYTLEKNNFRSAIISAMESCTNKAIKMSKNN